MSRFVSTRFRSSSRFLLPFKLATLVVLCGVASKAAWAAPLAVLSDVKGKTEVVRGAKTEAGKGGSQLAAGDLVRVTEGSATIFYANRAPQVVRAGSQIRLGGASASSGKPSVWGGLLTGLTSGFVRRPQTRPMTQPGISNRDRVPVLIPRGSLLTPRIKFMWDVPAAFGFEDYQVTLLDAGGSIVWQGATKGTFLMYPDDAPRLREGASYTWQVSLRRKTASGLLELDLKSQSLPLAFRLATEAERIAVQKELLRTRLDAMGAPAGVRRLAVAQTYRGAGYTSEALATLKPQIYGTTSAAPAASSAAAPDDSADEATEWLEADILAAQN